MRQVSGGDKEITFDLERGHPNGLIMATLAALEISLSWASHRLSDGTQLVLNLGCQPFMTYTPLRDGTPCVPDFG